MSLKNILQLNHLDETKLASTSPLSFIQTAQQLRDKSYMSNVMLRNTSSTIKKEIIGWLSHIH